MKYVTKNNLENTKIPVFECNSGKFVVVDADGNIISSADNLGSAKWWLNMDSGAGNDRTCYTASSDNYPFQTNGDYEGVDVSTATGCTITYENGNLTITSSWTAVDNEPLTLGTLDLGKVLCYKTSS